MSQSELLEVQGLFKKYFSRRGDEIVFRGNAANYRCPEKDCPSNIPGHHSFNKIKLSVSFDAFIYHCWICSDSGGLSKLANNYFDLTDRTRLFAIKKNHKPEYSNHTYNSPEFGLYLAEFEPFLSFDDTNTLDYPKRTALNYLFKRGITTEHILFYNIMFSRHRDFPNKIVVPSYSASGMMNFFVTRGVDSGYKNPPVKKGTFIFNEHLIDWNQELLIVEGPFDYLKLHGYNRAVLLGSSLNHNFQLYQKLLYHRTPVNICIDPDAKVKKGYALANGLMRWGNTVRFGTEALEQAGLQDPGEITEKSTITSILETQVVNRIDILRSRIISTKIE